MKSLFGCVLVICLSIASIATAAPPTDQNKDEARSHFELGLSHFDREEWGAALVEFLKSHELFPSKGNTKNAAICLRKVGRFDEALDLFEKLVRDFPDLSPTDRELAQKEITDLQASVATIAIVDAPDGATISIDAVERGKAPLKPTRLAAGSHSVRVTMEGLLPFEAKVDLAGRQAVTLHAHLDALTQAGRLVVSEHTGKSFELVVDGSVVGHTPWEGALAPGPHTIWLKGDATFGTQPQKVLLTVAQPVKLDLVAEELGGELRVTPQPATGEVTIDDVTLGKGVWQGRMRVGAHTLRVVQDGFLPYESKVTLDTSGQQEVTAKLELDPAFAPGGGHFSIELDAAAGLGLLVGGDPQNSCTDPCSAGVPVGFNGLLWATYHFASGFGVGLSAGYDLLFGKLTNRSLTVVAGSKPPSTAPVDETQRLGGIVLGGGVQYRLGTDWPLTLRLGVGVEVASVRDQRDGTGFFDHGDNRAVPQRLTPQGFAVNTAQSASGIFLYVAPEIRLGRKFGKHVELSIGTAFRVLVAVSKPTWDGNLTVPAGGDGSASMHNDALTGQVVLQLTPGLGFRYEF